MTSEDVLQVTSLFSYLQDHSGSSYFVLLLCWYPVPLDCDRAGNSCVIYVQSMELLGQVGGSHLSQT